MKILDHFEQGSLEWAQARCGKITMSHAKELLTGGKGKTRESYLLDVVAERLSGQPIDGYQSIDMQRGNFLEDYARRAVEAALGLKIRTVGLVLHDDERIACSPDGLVDDGPGLEIKCPRPRQHLRNLVADGWRDSEAQIQGNIWVCDRDDWFFASFCPWVTGYPLYIRLIKRDDDSIGKLERSAIEGADYVDSMAECAAAGPIHKGLSDISAEAKAAWDSMSAEKSDVII